MDSRKWEVLNKSSKGNKSSTSIKGITRILLKNRGIKTEKERKEFFKPIPPEKIGIRALGIRQIEINKAIKRIKRALRTKEKVIVYGDYDADGICGTAVLWETLYSLGLNVLPYIPERFSEGYGLNAESIKKLKTEDSKLGLIITVDHGIVANKKVDVAKELGIDVIITDHHEPGKKRPKSHATIHTTKIGGAAVAWIFSREILKKLKKLSTEEIKSSLELVAIGTIADQLSLTHANRSFAKYGLVALQKTKRVGLLALFEKAGIPLRQGDGRQVGPYEVGFLIAPRLNAMGRLEHAMQSLRLLCTKDKMRATELAEDLNRVNLERQRIVDEVVAHARKRISEKTLGNIIVLAHEGYHEGVIGLAASKLVEEFYRPAIVFSKKEKIAKASARSIAGFNIIQAIRKAEGYLLEGGGHPMAAGFSIEVGKIDEFSKKLLKASEPFLTDEILTKRLKIDLELPFRQLNWDLYKLVQSFEPTGLGNPAPVFMTKDVTVRDAKIVGRDGKHLKLKLSQAGKTFDAIMFGSGELYVKLSSDKPVSIAYQLIQNIWDDTKKLQLKIKDIEVQ